MSNDEPYDLKAEEILLAQCEVYKLHLGGGFGRRGNLSLGTLRLVRALSFSAAVTLAIGAYLLVAASEFGVLATALIAASLVAIAVVIRVTSRQSVRTSYRKLSFGLVDWGLVVAAIAIVVWATTFATVFEQVLRS